MNKLDMLAGTILVFALVGLLGGMAAGAYFGL